MKKRTALETQSQRISQLLLWALLIFVPLPLGSNRPIFWVFNGFFSALILCAFLVGNARLFDSLPSLKFTTWLVGGFLIVINWMWFQSIPITSEILAHPLRSRFLEGLPKAYNSVSANPAATLTTIAEFTPVIFLGVVAALISEDSNRGIFAIKVNIFVATILAVFGLSALYWDFPQVLLINSDAYAGSLTSTFVGRGAAATYFAIALVCAVALLAEKLFAVGMGRTLPSALDFVSELISRHGLYLVAIAILLSALLNTGSRAGVVSGLAGLLVVGAASWYRVARAGLGRVSVLLITSLAVGVIGVSSTHLVHRLETVDPAADVRFLLYSDTLRMILDRPMLGHGAGVFADLYPMYQSGAVPVSLVWNKAHDTYLQGASELGLPGLLLILLIAAACLWRILKCIATCRKPAATAVAALGAFTVAALHSIFDFSLQIQAVAIPFAIVAGAGYGEANRLLFESRAPYRSGQTLSPLGVASTARTAHTAVVVMLLVGIGVLVVSAMRLGLVVSAMPAHLWLTELPPLVAPNEAVETSTAERAEDISKLIRDPALVTARIVPCREDRAAARTRADTAAFSEATKTCLDIVDDALAANPFSSELWLERSKLLFRFPLFKLGFSESLRRSYETSPRAGWLAASRVIVGMQDYLFLPADLQSRAKEDLALVISTPEMAGQLIALFVANKSFREVAIPIVESLKPEQQRAFLELVKNRINSETSSPYLNRAK